MLNLNKYYKKGFACESFSSTLPKLNFKLNSINKKQQVFPTERKEQH